MTKKFVSEFAEKYKELANTIKEAQDKIKVETQGIIGELFSEFFTKHGEKVYAIHWTQYTPYFNDGEACEFSVCDFCLAFTEDDYDDREDASGEFSRLDSYLEHLDKWVEYEKDPQAYYNNYVANYSGWGTPQKFEQYKPTYYEKNELIRKINYINQNPQLREIGADFAAITKLLGTIDDKYFEMIYGDHVRVTYYGPDGKLEVNDYDHD